MAEFQNFVLEESFQVTSADTDFSKTLKPSSLINMLIQIAWHHAEKLGFGMEFLHSNGLVWMLSRMHVIIYSQPLWNEMLQLKSWPKGIRRLFYLRDFEVSDALNRPVAKATSEWLIIDLHARRPKLYHPEYNIFQENKDRHAIQSEVPNLKSSTGGSHVFKNRVVYSDIDLNNHLTTTRYIDWMMDTFELQCLSDSKCCEVVINFIKEVPYGTEVVIRRFEQEKSDQYLFEFQTSDNTHTYFRGQLNFKAI
jgi:medium-chain acyl-[acyl-carrier-protein] hydrolase